MDTQRCRDRCLPPYHTSFSHPPYFIISLAAASALHAAAIFLFINIFTIEPSLAKKPQIYSISIFSLKKRPNTLLNQKNEQCKSSNNKKSHQKVHKINLKIGKARVIKKHIKKYPHGITPKLQKLRKIEKTKKPLMPTKETIHAKTVAIHKKTAGNKQTTNKEENSAKGIKNLKGKNKIKTKSKIFLSEDGYPSIYSWIASHKFYPIEALFKDEQGSVTTMFTINTDGTLTNIKISKGSFKSLNKATVKIIENSSPIPKRILKHSNLKLPATVIIKLVFKINN